MTPPTFIDGTKITGATIDGQDVEEITVDGQTVFSAVPDSGLLRYELDQTAEDSWRDRDGSLVGGSFSTDSEVGTHSALLDGVDDQIDIDGDEDGTFDDPFDVDLTAGHSLAAHVKVDDLTSRHPVWGGSGTTATWEFRVSTTGEYEVVVFGSSNGGATSNSSISAGSYAFIGYSYDAGADQFDFYLDGSPDGTVARNGVFDETNPTNRFGASFDGNRRFGGRLDDPRFYDRALTDAEWSELFSTGSI
jgi:hypothetical protein